MQQGVAAAASDFTQAEHGVETMALDALVLVVAIGVIKHLPQLDHILQAVDHPRGGRLAVAPSTTGFLIIGFEAFRQVEVGDKAHVRFVDAHTKGDGGDDNDFFFTQKTPLILLALFGVNTGVVGQGIKALITQPLCDSLNFFPRQAVDNAGVMFVFAA